MQLSFPRRFYKIQIKPLKYFGHTSALRHFYKENFPKEPSVSITPDSFFKSFLKSAKGNKVVNKKLVSLKRSLRVKSQLKWNSSVASDEGRTTDWKTTYGLAVKCTKSATLINVQYRFLHRILPTNFFLTKIGIRQDPNCCFCSNAPENLIPLFWYCTKVKLFWKNLTDKLLNFELIPRNYPKDIAVLLGLRPDTSKFSLQLNFCFLLARHYIWCCKTSNKIPNLKMFLTVVKSQFILNLIN